MRICFAVQGLVSLVGICAVLSLRAGTTAFVYQGLLSDGAAAATGLYDLQFTLCEAATGGAVVAGPLTNAAVGVANGVFTTGVDFGPGAFTGADRWLEIAARTNGAGPFIALTPRQAITPSPMALYSATAASSVNYTGAVSPAQLSGPMPLALLPAGLLTNNAAGVSLTGTFSGFGAGLSLTNSRFTGPFSGWSTNAGVGWYFASDYGYSPTNTPGGNAAAMDACIADASSHGGGTIIVGSVFSPSSFRAQVINDSGEHLIQGTYRGYGYALVRIVGDGSITIHSTLASTKHGVFYGQFDMENLSLTGTGTNSSWAYPYTNSVGLYFVGFFAPHVYNVTVAGFGQDIAMCQLGSYAGGVFNHVVANAADIGFAVGDQCDSLRLVSCDGRSCAFAGLYAGCCTPNPVDVFPYLQIYWHASGVTRSAGVVIDGGIWAYNYIDLVLGQCENWKVSAYGESARACNVVIGHPPGTYGYPGGSAFVCFDGCTWNINCPETNIVVAPGADGGLIDVRNCGLGGKVGILAGPPVVVTYDYLTCPANLIWDGQVFTEPSYKLMTYPGGEEFEFNGLNSPPYTYGHSYDLQTPTPAGLRYVGPWAVGFIDGQRNYLARAMFQSDGAGRYQFVLTNATYFGNGAGLTNLNAADLVGQIPGAQMAWVLTNVTTTNLIGQVTPDRVAGVLTNAVATSGNVSGAAAAFSAGLAVGANAATAFAVGPDGRANWSGLYACRHSVAGVTNLSGGATTVFSCPVSGGAIGSNGTMRITLSLGYLSATNISWGVYYGATRITGVTGYNPQQGVPGQCGEWQRSIRNWNSQAVQHCPPDSENSCSASYAAKLAVAQFDTSTNFTLSVQMSNTGLSQTNWLDSVDVEILHSN